MPSVGYVTVVTLAHLVILVGIGLRVIMLRRPVGISLAWIAVVAVLPFVGALAYAAFGEVWIAQHVSRQSDRASQRLLMYARNTARQHKPDLQLPDTLRPIADLTTKVVGFAPVRARSVQLLSHSADEIFDALLADIAASRAHCYLEFYIAEEGGRVGEVLQALMAASQRGVSCKLILDAYGSSRFLRTSTLQELQAAGIDVRKILPIALPTGALARIDVRMHRKLVVIDDTVVYTGSFNLVDPRFFKLEAHVGQWIDAFVRVEGLVAAYARAVFEADWALASGEEPNELVSLQPLVDHETASEGCAVQIIPSGPLAPVGIVHEILLTAIYAARREIVLTTPYFVPDDAVVSALSSAALRGVRVVLNVPATADSRLVQWASRSYFDELLNTGVEIHEFHGGLLHTKAVRIDDAFVLLGSVNLDMRSFWLNLEISLALYDPGFCGQVRLMQERYLAQSSRIDAAIWLSRGRWPRFVENSARLLSPML